MSKIQVILERYRRPSGRVQKGIVKCLSEKYNVHPSTISLIGKGKS